ncbi:MAG: hypothetical protein ACR2NP_16215, partial [Pirellulaceae bacterium]
ADGSGAADRLILAIRHLHDTARYAERLEVDIWQFAVPLRTLRDLGIMENDCRYLVFAGLAVHAVETTLSGDMARAFHHRHQVTIGPRSCFVIGSRGRELAAWLLGNDPSEATRPDLKSQVPVWNDERQELQLDDQVIKRFKLPAPNQTRVLRAFEEEKWKPRIDDPLPPKAGLDPKRRLHDTINSLNRNQKVTRIRFFGDGTGKGICWELVH